jgi:DNA (cytosine-5)-methyltransferase 1
MGKPRLLDLFCGAGGASMGYYRVGFEVVGVDIKPQPHYPFEFHQADALTYPLGGFDAYHASPPCQAYADANANGLKPSRHQRLIEPIRIRLNLTGKIFVIENTHKAPLNATLMICGTMFGLKVIRHRYFEFNFAGPLSPFSCNHWGQVASGEFLGIYARGGKGHRHGKGLRDASSEPPKITAQEAMGIDWMTKEELTQAIPPAYTEYIGKYLLKALVYE